MQLAVRFATSLIIAFWGALMILLGIAQGQLLWVPLGLAVLAVGLPMIAANPLVTERLYPSRTDRVPAR